jgi:hypothetical protein
MVTFSAPATGGSRLDWKTVLGQLLVIVPIDVKKDVPTKLGDPTDVVVADVHILDGPDQGSWEPEVWVFPKVLKAQLEPKVREDGAEMVLGRLIQEPTQKGSPAWKLADPTPEDVETAQRWHAWRTGQGLPVTSVRQATSAPAAAPAAPPATSFTPTPTPAQNGTLAEQIRADEARRDSATQAAGRVDEPPF